MSRYYKDAFGARIRSGDIISFSYGIPPVGVRGEVYVDNVLWVKVPPPHKPERITLRKLLSITQVTKEQD